MDFSTYLYFALLYTAIGAFFPALKTLPTAYRHYKQLKFEKLETETAIAAILVALGITLHALEEILYKSGRIVQYFQGKDPAAGAHMILDTAAGFGIISLSLAVHYLNRGNSWYKKIYWVGHAAIFAWFISSN